MAARRHRGADPTTVTSDPAGPTGRVHVTASPWAGRTLADLLAEHGLAGIAEAPFPNDGWSGATLTSLQAGGRRFILKRTSWSADWIARSTRDHALREAVLAATPIAYRRPLTTAHLGAAADGTAAAILMPDLSDSLLHWDASGSRAEAIRDEDLDRVLAAMAAVHAHPWDPETTIPGLEWPWCPIRERVQLLTRQSAERYRAGGVWVGERFLAGWDAFDRLAPAGARALIGDLSAEPAPLLDALARLPATGLHGDLKLANVALHRDGTASMIDWQMITRAPVAVELGWFLVANVGQLPDPPDRTMERYRAALAAGGAATVEGDWAAQRDLALIIGLLLRGWRKGLDAEAALTLPGGTGAAEDLAWWCREAVEAAARRL